MRIIACSCLVIALLHALNAACEAQLTAPAPGAVGSPNSFLQIAALRLIQEHYVDSVPLDTKLPIKEVISKLDPFSSYITSEEYKTSLRSYGDHAYRYGVQFGVTEGHVILTSVLPGGAADSAGLLPGDEIVAIWGAPVNGSDSIANVLFLSMDSIELALYRASADSSWKVYLHRTEMSESSVPVVSMVDSQVGYIAITAFHRGTSGKLRRAVTYLEAKGMRALIIDVRWNPGGFVDEVLKALNLFVSQVAPVLTLRAVDPRAYEVSYLQEEPAFSKLPLAVLVNNGSCSAAEIFAGTLQDLDRAIVIGQPTVGKALVMNYLPLPNGDWLFLATARYTLVSGRCIQRQYHDGKLIGPGTRNFSSCNNSRHQFDSMFSENECRSYKTAGGKSLTSNSGIIPDYLVQEESFFPEWLREAINVAAAGLIRKNAAMLVATTLDSFEHYVTIPEASVKFVLEIVRSHDSTNQKLLSAQLAWMAPKIIKAYVGYSMWGQGGFFKLWEQQAATVRLAVQLLRQEHSVALSAK